MLQTYHTPPSRPPSRTYGRNDVPGSNTERQTIPGQFTTRAAIMELILSGAQIDTMYADPGVEGTTNPITLPSWDGDGMIIGESTDAPREDDGRTNDTHGADDSAFS